MSNKLYNFFDDFRKFLIKPQVGTAGFITAVVIGNSTYQFLKSFIADIFMPVIGLVIGRKRLTEFHIGEIKIGQFAVELLSWTVIMLVLFVFIEYMLKTILQTNDTELTVSADPGPLPLAPISLDDDENLEETRAYKESNDYF